MNMEKQKGALLRIVHSLQQKYDDVLLLESNLSSELDALKEAYNTNLVDLCGEFDKLYKSLKTKQDKMKEEIHQDFSNKEEIIKNQLSGYEVARKDAAELMETTKKALEMENLVQFNQVAVSIKERITMSTIFRLSASPINIQTTCRLVVDFSKEEMLLTRLDFLPIPTTPMLLENDCVCVDNKLYLKWNVPVLEDVSELETNNILQPSTDMFVLQYRQVKDDQNVSNVPWSTIENIKDTSYCIEDLKFFQPHIQARLQTWNKAAGGEFSNIITIQTEAFDFCFDPNAAHGNLKVVDPYFVEWNSAATKPVEVRVRSAGTGRVSSSNKLGSPVKSKDRFIGESYTILGDTVITLDEVYFQVAPHKDCKIYSIGVSSASLNRYEQLGKTPHSWCLCVSRWIQNTFVAKHNNKLKNLDAAAVPKLFGVLFNKELGFLSFYNADTRECLYTFKQIKNHLPVVVGFSLWCGSLKLFTGLQVPSWLNISHSPSGNNVLAVSSETSVA